MALYVDNDGGNDVDDDASRPNGLKECTCLSVHNNIPMNVLCDVCMRAVTSYVKLKTFGQLLCAGDGYRVDELRCCVAAQIFSHIHMCRVQAHTVTVFLESCVFGLSYETASRWFSRYVWIGPWNLIRCSVRMCVLSALCFLDPVSGNVECFWLRWSQWRRILEFRNVTKRETLILYFIKPTNNKSPCIDLHYWHSRISYCQLYLITCQYKNTTIHSNTATNDWFIVHIYNTSSTNYISISVHSTTANIRSI